VDVKTLSDHPFMKNPTVGLGPFKFVRYETDQFVELEKNPNYRAPVGFDKVFLKPVTTDVATAQLEKGEMQLVQISPTDPVTFAGMVLTLALVAVVASYLPARRASKAEPMDVLRGG